MPRERIGHIAIHYFSGQIEHEMHVGLILESQFESIIKDLPNLPNGTFYAFHAERFARPDEMKGN